MGLRCCGWVAQPGSHMGVWTFSQHLVVPKVCEQSVIRAALCAWAFIIWDSAGCRGPKLCQWEHQLPNRNVGLCLCCALAQLYFLGISAMKENLCFWADNMIAASKLKLIAKKCKSMEECKPGWVLSYSSPIYLAFFPEGCLNRALTFPRNYLFSRWIRHDKITLPWDGEVSGVCIHTFFEIRRGSITQRITAASAEYCVVPVQNLWACSWWPGMKVTAWLPYEEESLVRSRKKKIELAEK